MKHLKLFESYKNDIEIDSILSTLVDDYNFDRIHVRV